MYGFRNFFYDRGPDGEIINLYLANPDLKISEISQQTGKSQAEIYRILHSHNISPNRLKLNHEKVIHLHNAGWGIQEISQFTGYTTRNVRYIVAKKGLNG